MCVRYVETEIGLIGIREKDQGITEIFFADQEMEQQQTEQPTELLLRAEKQLLEYLAGKRTTFDLPLTPIGTEFQKSVWNALQTIPYGQTASYKMIAEQIGKPKACRAVGLANNRNPIVIVIPCHRVIGSNGRLVGYGGGLPIKQHLLELEHKTR